MVNIVKSHLPCRFCRNPCCLMTNNRRAYMKRTFFALLKKPLQKHFTGTVSKQTEWNCSAARCRAAREADE